MSEQTKSRKPLIVGIIAAVAILGALLALVLTQCTGEQGTTEPTPVQTTAAVEETLSYDIYWNLDRALYDGKSEAGMSSRQPAADGFFYVRFFKDGQTVELKVADRRTINGIDVLDMMGLEFDQDGIVVGVIPLSQLPLDTRGSDFFVQGYGTGALKINSSNVFNGMELILNTKNALGIWDMTGMEGEPGTEIRPIPGDRVKVITNLNGEVTHVFVYSRTEYMQTVEAECEHCGKVVEWKLYTKTDILPTALSGHYKLQNDVQLKAQMSLAEDVKICLDLNGYTVNGAQNKRVFATWEVGSELALMDTSESQKGRVVAHNKTVTASQGYAVLIYKGAFYMYGGTLDASDAVTGLFGAAVSVTKETYFYMNGGTIIGGTAKCYRKEGSNSYSGGIGGSVAVFGKFVMNGGTIKNGKAEGVITGYGADGMPNAFQRGVGGNVYVAGGCEFVMNGGTIQNGSAVSRGGNVYLDGAATMTMTGGTITGGKVTGYGRQGGNICIGSKAQLDLSGGVISNGQSTSGGGNVYCNGKVIMTGGYITGGITRNYKTNKVAKDDNRCNLFLVNGHFYMYGGTITGSALCIDTSETDKHNATLALGGVAKIVGPENKTCADLTLSASGGGVTVLVYKLMDAAQIGINAPAGIFTNKTDESNLDNFIPYVENMEISYVDGCLALGRQGCLCGKNEDGQHFGECDGTKHFWSPVNSSLKSSASGYVYLTQDLEIGQHTIGKGIDLVIDLNGYTLSGRAGARVLMAQGEGAKITIIDSSEAQTGKLRAHGEAENIRGCLLLATQGGQINLYGGTFDASEFSNTNGWSAGADGVFGTADDKDAASDGGAVVIGAGCTVNMYGGKLIGAKLESRQLVKTVTEGETTKEVKRTVGQPSGAAVDLSNGSVFNLYGGTVVGNSAKAGGAINCAATGIINLMGGIVEGGSAADGGNIFVSNKGAVLNILGNAIIRGGQATTYGGNICLKNGAVNVSGNAQILNGTASNGGNIHTTGTLTITGGEVKGGTGKSYNATNNIFVVGSALVLRGGVVDGGLAVTNNETTRATVTISGNPVVSSANTGLNLMFTKNSTLGLPMVAVDGEITEGASIALTTKEDGLFTAELSAAYAEAAKGAFVPCNTSKDVLIRDGETADTYRLWLGKETVTVTKCLCGSTSENPADHSLGCREAVLTKGGEKNNAQKHEWVEWTADSLPTTSGYYFLNQADKTVNIDTRYAPAADAVIVLDLNGHTVLDKSARVLCTWDGSTNVSLTITDTVGGGVICFAEAKEISELAGMIGLGEASQLNLVGGTLDASKLTLKGNSGNGGVLYVSADSVFNMYGGTLLSANSVNNGGAITLVKGSVNIFDGQIVAGNATEGGAIYMYAGTLNISGGTITAREGANAKDGGLIFVNGGNATISGTAQVNGGTATGKGGNIYIKAGATLEVKDSAKIYNGTSTSSAGNIYVVGKLIVSGGEIVNGNSGYDAAENIYVLSGTLELRGGQIDGSVLALNYNDANSTVKISGNPVVGNKYNGLNLSYSKDATTGIPMIQVDGELGEGASIVVYAKDDGYITAEFPAASLDAVKKALVSYTTAKVLTAKDGETAGTYRLWLGAEVVEEDPNTYCLCGSESTNPDDHSLGCREAVLTKGGEKNNAKKHSWTEWTADTLPTTSGFYFLSQADKAVPVSTDLALEEGAVIVLDLNGHTVVDTSGRVLDTWRNSNVVLTIVDTAGGGSIRFNSSKALNDKAGIFGLSNGSVLNLVNGTLDASRATLEGDKATSELGGGVLHIDGESVFNMYGGRLLSASKTTYGGAITLKSGAVNIYAGQIVAGNATEGGAIYMTAGTLNISGGSFTIRDGAKATNGGILAVTGGIATLSGDATFTGGTASSYGGNVYARGGTVTVGENAQLLNGYAASGGNIYTTSNLVISGGTVQGGTGNSYKQTANIFAVDANLELRGGTVDGGVVLHSNSRNATIKVSGNPVVSGTNGGLTLRYKSGSVLGVPQIQFDGALTTGVSIAVSTMDDGVFTQEFAAAGLESVQAAFTPVSASKTITAVSGDTEGTYRLSIG